jgi:hypothetical protein
MAAKFVVKGNRLLYLLGLIFRAHIDLSSNTLGDKLYSISLIDIANQSLAIAGFSLSLHSLIKEDSNTEFRDALNIALRMVARYKEVQNIELIPKEIKLAISEIESLVVDLTESITLA